MKVRALKILAFFIITVSFCSLSSAAPGDQAVSWEYYFQINPHFGYSQANIYGSGQVPTYTGATYGAEIAYLIGTPIFTLAPFLSYRVVGLDNTANSATSSSSIEGSLLTYGLMLVTQRVYLRAGFVKPSLEEKVTGNAIATFQANQEGLELGAGLTYPLSDYIWANLGLDINHIKADAPLPSDPRLDFLSYTLVFKVSIALPSGF